MDFKIYVDDERPKPSDFDVVVRSNPELIDLLNTLTVAGISVDTISFDHDNMHGDDFYGGLTAMAYLGYWPKNLVFHTANRVAHGRMIAFATEHAPMTTFIDPRYFYPMPPGIPEFG